jgi:hypothetical protein
VALVDIRLPPSYSDEGPARRRRDSQALPAVALLVLSRYVEASTLPA